MAEASSRRNLRSSDGPPINDAGKPQRIRAGLLMRCIPRAPMLQQMTARAVQQLEARLEDLCRVGWSRLGTAIAAALLAGPAHLLDPALSAALAAGAFVLALLSLRAFADRCELVDSLAADRDALTIAAVRARAGQIAARRELDRAAATLRRLAESNKTPRVAACRPELLELADALLSPPAPELSVAVACVRFVEAPESPLFDLQVSGVEICAQLRHLLVLLDAENPQRGSAPPPIPADGTRADLTTT
jgi:hypothetical protein